MKNPHVVFVSGSHIWSMGASKGASSFYRTVKHYALSGWRVDLIIGNDASGLDIADVRVHQWYPKWMFSLMGIRRIGAVARLVYLLAFTCFALVRLGATLRKSPGALIYAYEIHGVPAGWLARVVFGGKLVSRFQGTVLYPVLNTPWWRARFWDHYLAMRVPVDLVIMANDGTLGDTVIKAINPRANLRFWMNGLSFSPALAGGGVVSRPTSGTHEYTLVTSSRLVRWKRVDRIISALPRIINTIPSCRLVVLGDGPEAATLNRLAESLGVRSHVLFVGAIPQCEVASHLLQADLFVSLYELSNVGNPLLEAMWLGLPVLTLDNGGTAEVVRSGYNGVLIGEADLPRLSDIVVSLLEDVDSRVRMGRNAGAYARQRFKTWDARLEMEIEEALGVLAGRDPECAI